MGSGRMNEHGTRSEMKKSLEQKRRSATVGFALGVLITSVSATHAATYYVDSKAGSDSASGTVESSAWQHLSAVNRFAMAKGFRPGDKILLKSGSRWGEQLELTATSAGNSGGPGSPLTIGSYGQGSDLPTLDGADVVKGWTSAGDGVYKAQVKGPVYKVFVDGANRETKAILSAPNYMGPYAGGRVYQPGDTVSFNHLMWQALRETQKSFKLAEWQHVGMLPPEQQDAGAKNVTRIPGTFFYDAAAGTLYLHTADGSDPSQHTVQASVRRYGVMLGGLNYVTVTGLRVIHAGKAGVLATTTAAGGNEYGTIQNNVFWNNADASADADSHGEGAIYVVAAEDGSVANPLRGWVVADNAVGRIDSGMATNYQRSGIYLSGTTGAAVRNNYVATTEALGISVTSDGKGPACTTPVISGNLLTDNQGNIRLSGCAKGLIDSNIIRNSAGYGIQTGGNSTAPVVTHNLIHDLTASASKSLYNGVDCNGGAPGGVLAYNSISAVWAAEATLEGGCDHWNVHDNYFDSSKNAANGGLTLYIRQEALPGMQFQNNHYNVNPSTDHQFNVGAGQPGVNTFHDVNWWKGSTEPTSKVGEAAPREEAIPNGGTGRGRLEESPAGLVEKAVAEKPDSRLGAQQALPTTPFHATVAKSSLERDGGGKS